MIFCHREFCHDNNQKQKKTTTPKKTSTCQKIIIIIRYKTLENSPKKISTLIG